jgi:hypothetical protein
MPRVVKGNEMIDDPREAFFMKQYEEYPTEYEDEDEDEDEQD